MSEAKTSFIVLGLIIAVGLSACGEQVSLCKEAMGMRGNQLGVGDKDRQKFIDNCRMSGGVYTVDQWQCLIAAMKKGTAYEEATEQCVP